MWLQLRSSASSGRFCSVRILSDGSGARWMKFRAGLPLLGRRSNSSARNLGRRLPFRAWIVPTTQALEALQWSAREFGKAWSGRTPDQGSLSIQYSCTLAHVPPARRNIRNGTINTTTEATISSAAKRPDCTGLAHVISA